MNRDHIKLLGVEPAQEQPAPPPYPLIQFAPTEQGGVFSILLGPFTSINQLLPPDAMDGITKQWRDFKKSRADALAAIQHFNTHGRND